MLVRAIKTLIRWVADPPWPRELSLYACLGLAAYALFDATQAAGTPSPVSFAWQVGLPLADKWVHLAGYGAVALSGCQALVPRVIRGAAPPRGISGRLSAVLNKVAPQPVLAAIAVGLFSTMVAFAAEVIQANLGRGRSGELEDAIVSGLGAAIAVVAFLLSRALRQQV